MLKSYTKALFVLILGLACSLPVYSQGKKESLIASVGAQHKLDQQQWKNHLKDLKSRNNFKPSEDTLSLFGPGTSGGGNSFEAEFHYLSEQLIREILKLSFEPTISRYLNLVYLRLKNESSIYFTDNRLFLEQKEKIAINDFEEFVVLVNKKLWNQSTFSQKRQIIVHELLGLAKSLDSSIDDSSYAITNQIFEKLEKQAQKNFLLNTDYPARFQSPELESSRFEGQQIQYQINGEKNKCADPDSKILLSLKKVGSKIEVMFEISCQLASGQMFGHIEGKDGDTVLDVTSKNILELNVDYGSFIVGWVSGPNMLIRTPFQLMTLTKKSDGTYALRLELNKAKNEIFETTVKAIVD